MIIPIFARSGVSGLPAQGASNLARWQVLADGHEEAVAIVRESGVPGPLFALIEGGPPQIVVSKEPP